MILEEIVLHNYGLYRGRHAVPLAPLSPSKPIILIGGLNGGGKTTFLDAIQLSLYGKRSRCSNRGSVAYEEYLGRCINRSVAPSDGAAVELQFRHRSEGREHTYRVHRSWAATRGGVSERVEVLCDGSFDRVLTEEWNEVVDDFIPSSISHLFFFDGEKIEAFADLDNSARLLDHAIRALLGLDLVERLTTDLQVVEGRQRKHLRGRADRKKLEEAERAYQEAEARRAHAELELRPTIQGRIDELEKRLRVAESRYEAEGGHLLDGLREIEAEKAQLDNLLEACTLRAKELAAGVGPLLIVEGLIHSAAEQADTEETIKRGANLGEVLAERDSKVLDIASEYNVPKAALRALKKYLEADRLKRFAGAATTPSLNLSHDAHGTLRKLVHGTVLKDTRDEIVRVMEQMQDINSCLADTERKLAGVPDAESLAPLLDEITSLRTRLNQERAELASLDSEIERLWRERDAKKAAWVREAERTLDVHLENEDAHRILAHSERVRRTLEDFKGKVVRRHVWRIEDLVLDSFKQLLRKQSLISELRIDPTDFAIELRGGDGQAITPDRLSAGERQLMAVSLLWGLARASGRPLPAVIDTPLGRLDASHRLNLIERYFPHASHQVLLLSTDEEIDEALYAKLKPWIGRSYRLDFNDQESCTTPRQGYFW